MPLSDPKERFKRVTDKIFFSLNKREFQSESKTACAVVRLDGIEEREWISIHVLKVLLYASVLDSVHVWAVCLWVISKQGEWEGLPCDTGHLCHSCFIYDMITNTHILASQIHRRTPTSNKEPGRLLCLQVSGLILPEAWMGLRDTVTVSQDPRGRPWDWTALPGERWVGVVTLWWGVRGGRGGNRPEAYCGDGEIATSAAVATQTDRVQHTKMHTHAHSGESYSDGQFCHQRLPSCHSDMERLGPYERLCSPKRCLGAGVGEIRQSLLMRGHNQMWKLSCTLTGSIVAKSTARCNIDAVLH